MTTIPKEITKRTQYSLMPFWGFVPAGRDQALKRLVAAVIVQACYDAVKNNHSGAEARGWLLSGDCSMYCDFVNMDHAKIKAWVSAGCPEWREMRSVRSDT